MLTPADIRGFLTELGLEPTSSDVLHIIDELDWSGGGIVSRSSATLHHYFLEHCPYCTVLLCGVLHKLSGASTTRLLGLPCTWRLAVAVGVVVVSSGTASFAESQVDMCCCL